MGRFFIQRIPAIPTLLVRQTFLKFFWLIPPRAIKLFFSFKTFKLNLIILRFFLFFGLLNKGERNINLQFWDILILISFLLWAEPIK